MDFRIIDSKNIDNIDALYKNASEEKSVFLYEPCAMKKDGYVIVDFGKETCGVVHIVFGFNENDLSVRVRLGESVYETCAELGEKNCGNYHSLRDNCYRTITNGDVSTSESGFRFVRIDFVGKNCENGEKNGEEVIRISRIYVEEHLNGLEKKGRFCCDDERVNDIYSAAERTIELCVRKNDIWDGVKRDRALWIGDLYPEMLSAFRVYGIIPQFETVLKAGIIDKKSWVNNIPSYSAWWIICLAEYYKMSGNRSFIEDLLPEIETIVDAFYSIIDENGEADFSKCDLYYFRDNEFFTDWPLNYKDDSKLCWRYIVSIAMENAVELYSVFGLPCEKARSIKERLKKYTYTDSDFKQVTAFGILSGFIDEIRGKKLVENGTLKGMTCFMSFAIIKAMEKVSDGETILELIKDYYGAMLDLGATTFWEDFDMSWLDENPDSLTALPRENKKNIHADFGKFCYKNLRFSLCHGWATGFVDFFFTYVLGVVPTAAGYSSVKVEPHLCGLKFAEGEIPTKYGTIYVRHEKKNGKIETTLKLPDGITEKK